MISSRQGTRFHRRRSPEWQDGSNAPRPFRCDIPANAIADLHERIDRARWPDQMNDEAWSHGTELNYLRELVQYWRKDFQWSQAQAEINEFDHFLLDIGGLDVHFIHQRSPHASATPLLITHGWPGSIVEFLDLIPRLTQPEKFGAQPEDAFHVVAPSLPGYGFSPGAREPGMHVQKIAERQVRLMATWGTRATSHKVATGALGFLLQSLRSILSTAGQCM